MGGSRGPSSWEPSVQPWSPSMRLRLLVHSAGSARLHWRCIPAPAAPPELPVRLTCAPAPKNLPSRTPGHSCLPSLASKLGGMRMAYCRRPTGAGAGAQRRRPSSAHPSQAHELARPRLAQWRRLQLSIGTASSHHALVVIRRQMVRQRVGVGKRGICTCNRAADGGDSSGRIGSYSAASNGCCRQLYHHNQEICLERSVKRHSPGPVHGCSGFHCVTQSPRHLCTT